MDWYGWLVWLEGFLGVLILVLFVTMLLGDADLTLRWKEKFGPNPDSILCDKVIWITGASSGIGEYLAYRLSSAGAKLVLSARREQELSRVKGQCLSRNSSVRPDSILVLPLDVTEYSTHNDAVHTVLQHFGKIDILVNNSGRSQRSLGAETDLEVHQDMMNVNYTGVISLTKAVLPHFMERKKGHFVVTSSIAGKIGAPGASSYSATKFALQGWFDTLRLEMFSHNIAVTMVCPGPVFSDIRKFSYTEKIGKLYGSVNSPGERRMETSRCAQLMAVAIANRLDEVWVSPQPVLLTPYLAQYFPDITKMLAKKMGVSTIDKLRR